ncbi:uncharacterized transmembrane protein DDB_G0289901 [Drosophila albomicans]|uniref:Uncharacterized transmembrane protein DDB_G0289901 n=1 Tax=Drosophila albomicans TaxID=7291 RepID=A0A9C6W9C3_DROAB|nr:uncharacterized transmembrane protein DDB_G0289901 [Drosophila albomicans]
MKLFLTLAALFACASASAIHSSGWSSGPWISSGSSGWSSSPWISSGSSGWSSGPWRSSSSSSRGWSSAPSWRPAPWLGSSGGGHGGSQIIRVVKLDGGNVGWSRIGGGGGGGGWSGGHGGWSGGGWSSGCLPSSLWERRCMTFAPALQRFTLRLHFGSEHDSAEVNYKSAVLGLVLASVELSF